MDIKKLAPWNWFKKEEEEGGATVPVERAEMHIHPKNDGWQHPVMHLHQEIDRLFDNAFRGFGLSPWRSELMTPLSASKFLKPQLDVGASDKEYSITVEVPGVEEKDVKIEIANNTMTITGEKTQEKEEKNKNFYRMERSYGSFQRVLSLPEDVKQEAIKATFKNGVLTVTMPRKAFPATQSKQIEIKAA